MANGDRPLVQSDALNLNAILTYGLSIGRAKWMEKVWPSLSLV